MNECKVRKLVKRHAQVLGVGVCLTFLMIVSVWPNWMIPVGFILTGLVFALTRDCAGEASSTQGRDPLTGAMTRATFFVELAKRTRSNKDGFQNFVVMMVDVNGFNKINEKFSLSNGDRCIQELHGRVISSLRSTDLVYRLGTDQFAVISNVDPTSLMSIATLLHADIVGDVVIDHVSIPMSVSIGATSCTSSRTDPETVFQEVERAMRHAKNEKTGIALYNPQLRSIDSVEDFMFINELKHAVEHDEIRIKYQPQHDVATGRIVGVEALARWEHPTLGNVAPDKFIVIAEREGLINLLLKNIVDRVFADVSGWPPTMRDLSFSINASADNFRSIGVISRIITSAERHSIDLSRMILEITETAILKNTEEAIKYLVMMNSLGIRLSIDDFGTGNSSFIYLKYLPIHEIKIDKTFVADAMEGAHDRAIIQSMVNLATSCNVVTVAEGVETPEQAKMVEEVGCKTIQGYLFSRPMSNDELKEKFGTGEG